MRREVQPGEAGRAERKRPDRRGPVRSLLLAPDGNPAEGPAIAEVGRAPGGGPQGDIYLLRRSGVR